MTKLRCSGCGRPYARGPDLVIPDAAWLKIAPRPDGGGVLCPNCIHDRLVAAGVGNGEAPGRFTSGPLSFDEPTEGAVAAAAAVIAESPMIDAPRLEPRCWHGLARAVLRAGMLEGLIETAGDR